MNNSGVEELKRLAKRGTDVLNSIESKKVEAICLPHNDDLTALATALATVIAVSGVSSPLGAMSCKTVVMTAFALGYKRAEQDGVKLDDVWNQVDLGGAK